MKIFKILLSLLIISTSVMYGAEEPRRGEPSPFGDFEKFPPLQREEWARTIAAQLSDQELVHWAKTSKELNALLQPIIRERPLQYWKRKKIVPTILKGGAQASRSLSFSPDGKLLASCSFEAVRLWNVATSDFTQVYTHDRLRTVLFSPKGGLLASGIGYGVVINKIEAEANVHETIIKTQNFVGPLSFSPDGSLLAISCYASHNLNEDSVIIINPETGKQKTKLLLEEDMEELVAMAFSLDGTMVYGVYPYNMMVATIETKNVRQIPLKRDKEISIELAQFSPDRKIVATAGSDYRESWYVTLWSVTTGKKIMRFAAGLVIQALAFSPDGSILAFGYRTIKLLNIHNGEIFNTLQPARPVLSLSFSPNGKILAAGEEDGPISLWGK